MTKGNASARPRKARRRYVPPAISEEEVFERRALATCTKQAEPPFGNCTAPTQSS